MQIWVSGNLNSRIFRSTFQIKSNSLILQFSHDLFPGMGFANLSFGRSYYTKQEETAKNFTKRLKQQYRYHLIEFPSEDYGKPFW